MKLTLVVALCTCLAIGCSSSDSTKTHSPVDATDETAFDVGSDGTDDTVDPNSNNDTWGEEVDPLEALYAEMLLHACRNYECHRRRDTGVRRAVALVQDRSDKGCEPEAAREVARLPIYEGGLRIRAVESGRLTVDTDELESCRKRMRVERTCERGTFSDYNYLCSKAFSPNIKQGEQGCEHDDDCERGTHCVVTNAEECIGECLADDDWIALHEGDSCENDRQCADDLYCSDGSADLFPVRSDDCEGCTCMTTELGKGEECQRSIECETGLYCQYSPGGRIGVCVEIPDAALPAPFEVRQLGDDCKEEGTRCDAHLFCEQQNDADGDIVHRCAERRAEFETCVTSRQCGIGLVCRVATKACTAPAADGEACDADVDCESQVCDEGTCGLRKCGELLGR